MAIEWDHYIDELNSLAANSDSVKLSKYGILRFYGQFNSIFTRMLDLFTDNATKEFCRIPMLIKLLDRHCIDKLATVTANIQARHGQGLDALGARSIAARLHASITCIDGLVKQGLLFDRSPIVRYVLDRIKEADGILLDDAREQFVNGGGDENDESFYHVAITALSAWRDRAWYTINRPLPAHDPREWDSLVSMLDTLSTHADAVHINSSGKFAFKRAVMDVIDEMVKFTTCTRRLVSVEDVTGLLNKLVATNCMDLLDCLTQTYSDAWKGDGHAGAIMRDTCVNHCLIIVDDSSTIVRRKDLIMDENAANGISIRLHAFSSCVCALVQQGSREWGERCHAYLEGHVDQASTMLDKYAAGEIGHFGVIDNDHQAGDCSALAIVSLRKWRDMLRFAMNRSTTMREDRDQWMAVIEDESLLNKTDTPQADILPPTTPELGTATMDVTPTLYVTPTSTEQREFEAEISQRPDATSTPINSPSRTQGQKDVEDWIRGCATAPIADTTADIGLIDHSDEEEEEADRQDRPNRKRKLDDSPRAIKQRGEALSCGLDSSGSSEM